MCENNELHQENLKMRKNLMALSRSLGDQCLKAIMHDTLHDDESVAFDLMVAINAVALWKETNKANIDDFQQAYDHYRD